MSTLPNVLVVDDEVRSQEALRLGIADGCFGTSPEDFLGEAVERAQRMAEPRAFAEAIRVKRERRERDEAEKPLERYREEELARMKLNFYGFDPSYHVARYHFARKLPKARTPGYLARQAQESNPA